MRSLSILLAAATAVTVSACGAKPPWRIAPSVSGAQYDVAVRTYLTGDYADEPFELMVRGKSAPTEGEVFLAAEQCKNVLVALTADELVIFYDFLALSHFASDSPHSPPPQLCDLNLPACKARLQDLTAQGASITQACTFK